MGKSKIDALRLRAAEMLAEFDAEEDLTADSLKDSVLEAGSMASTDRLGLATIWNVGMVAVGLGVYLNMSGYAAMAGVSWALFNAYPLGLAVWRWLT